MCSVHDKHLTLYLWLWVSYFHFKQNSAFAFAILFHSILLFFHTAFCLFVSHRSLIWMRRRPKGVPPLRMAKDTSNFHLICWYVLYLKDFPSCFCSLFWLENIFFFCLFLFLFLCKWHFPPTYSLTRAYNIDGFYLFVFCAAPVRVLCRPRNSWRIWHICKSATVSTKRLQFRHRPSFLRGRWIWRS